MSVPVHPDHVRLPRWPWALGFGLLVIGCGIVFMASFVVSSIVANSAGSRQESAVTQAVLDFDAAYEEQDCVAFRSVVNRDLADQLVGGSFDCRRWVTIAESLHRDGEYEYSVDVIDVTVTGNDATVSTEEYNLDSEVAYYTYTLERSDDGWVITRYDRE